MKKIILICLTALTIVSAKAAVTNGHVALTSDKLRPGASFDLNGSWLYKPGYAVTTNEAPQSAGEENNFKPVPVPQLLNRIHWWLDDSEDFKKSETERLKKLGFDTDRAEDGWYHMWLDLPVIPTSKHLFIEFDGVAMRSKTFCNGQLLGSHDGMFSRFSYDLTPQLKPGKNLIAVFVSMEKIPKDSLTMGEAVTVNLTASKVRSMSKGMYGPLSPNFDNRAYDLHGIWQPVKLVVRGDGKLNDVWFVPSLDGAEVRVEAQALGNAGKAKVNAKLTDAKTGKLFATLPSEEIDLSSTVTLKTLTLRSVKPKLWTPAEPNLYQLDVTLESNKGEVLDAWTHKVGFRTFVVQGNQLLLNGKPYWLRGANHLPYGKNPSDPALAHKLIQSLHDANIRITRTHATPWNEPWLSAADEIGLGVSLEGIRPWALAGKIGATPPELFAHWLMENEDVVKRARNHPSVMIYTIGNEMMLRDSKSIEKWQQLSDIVKQTRKLDPTRPVIASSEYARDTEFYNESLKPAGIDDGDADDLHRYNNWYATSSFFTDSKLEKEIKNNGGKRPIIGQEMSTGYPDLDNGLPVFRYTRDLVTPQAWVGNYSYPGSDPKYFLEHNRAVTKRWAESLRFERGTNTAGFMLFAAECWFSHSFDAATVKPYPVLEAMRDAFAPVGLALETGRRRFFPEEQIATTVFVTNDDEDQKDYSDLRLEVNFLDRATGKEISTAEIGRLTKLAYYETARVPVKITLPKGDARRELSLRLRLLNGNKEISRGTDYVEIWPAAGSINIAAPTLARGMGTYLSKFLQTTTRYSSATKVTDAKVILIGKGDKLAGLEAGGELRAAIEQGATAVLFSPDDKLTKLFPTEILDAKKTSGEFADFSIIAGTKLVEKLEPMDLKWWGRKDDWRVFVADASHRLKTNSIARELIRFIPAHSYIAADKVPEQYRTVMFEIPIGKGRLWVCDLDLENSITIDPAAQQFAINLFNAAADPASTLKR